MYTSEAGVATRPPCALPAHTSGAIQGQGPRDAAPVRTEANGELWAGLHKRKARRDREVGAREKNKHHDPYTPAVVIRAS